MQLQESGTEALDSSHRSLFNYLSCLTQLYRTLGHTIWAVIILHISLDVIVVSLLCLLRSNDAGTSAVVTTTTTVVTVVTMVVVMVIVIIVAKEFFQGFDFLDDLRDEAPLGLVSHDHELMRLQCKSYHTEHNFLPHQNCRDIS